MNEDIRRFMNMHNVNRSEIANALGIAESTLYLWLRHTMSDNTRREIIEATERLSKPRRERKRDSNGMFTSEKPKPISGEERAVNAMNMMGGCRVVSGGNEVDRWNRRGVR